jgi:hypothetical protein
MDLYIDIYQLLKRNDCVIIPQFGGFIANYFEAGVDLKKQEFFPPSRKIAFNESLKNNDGLLFNHLCNTRNISWNLAEEIVKKFVSETYNDLNEGKTVKFDDLGCFTKKSGVLTFVPNEKLNLLEDSFGFTEFNFPLLKSDKAVEINAHRTISQTKSAKINRRKKSYKSVWAGVSVAAVLAGLVAISVFFDFFNFDNKNINENYSKISPVELVVPKNTCSVEEIEPAVVQENEKLSVLENQEAANIEKELEHIENISAKEDNSAVEPVTQEIADQKIIAHTIAGSFAEYSNAEKMVGELEEAGLSPVILPLHNGLYRVSAKSYYNRNIAVKELEELRNKLDNSSMWVLYN